jgi:hypothetical protein
MSTTSDKTDMVMEDSQQYVDSVMASPSITGQSLDKKKEHTGKRLHSDIEDYSENILASAKKKKTREGE